MESPSPESPSNGSTAHEIDAKVVIVNRRQLILAWIDDRVGYRELLGSTFNRPVTGGARVTTVFGAALVAAFLIEVVTGLLLMFAYSPSSTTAWGSVYYINDVLTAGWFIRGMHLFGSHAMVVVAGLYVLQLLLTGAYKAPREILWWFGILLFILTLVLAVTGNPLTWDQKGFWAWNVETSIAGGAPVIGQWIQRVAIGGTVFGNNTITRLYGLHVVLLPLLFAAALSKRHWLLRRHGEPVSETRAEVSEPLWPRQVFYHLCAGFILVCLLAVMVLVNHGASLEAPADASSDYPARPEWFFLWLFQLRKSFPGPSEIIATMVIPGALVTVLFLLPFLDRLFPRRLAHFLACAFVFATIGGAGFLTVKGFQADAAESHYRDGRLEADRNAHRAVELARLGIPPEGASTLLARDPLTRGKAIFEQKCLGCHAFGDQTPDPKKSNLRGAKLDGFGSKEWVRGLLEDPDDPAYVVHVPTKKGRLNGMQEWKESAGYEAKELDDLADFVALMADIPADLPVEDWAADPKLAEHPGYQNFVDDCLSCHTVGTLGSEGKSRNAPNLYGYGSEAWVSRMIRNPDSKLLYGYLKEPQRMPPFSDQIRDHDLRAVIRYLKHDYVPTSATAPTASAAHP
jgi:ubiquinol-cytochrome c reductase cytochrome b subunit